ncbi:MAG: response regulator [Lachnospiraceae bacterium]|nr:response regulator [Lachnospiraceae bacterium]
MGERKKVLVVDDVAISLSVTEQALREHYEVITVNSGDRALRYMKKDRPDLILLDIRMDQMDGIETLKAIRKLPNGANIPVIMLTAQSDRATVIETAKLGIYDYMLKPFAPQELLSRVRGVLEPDKEAAAALVAAAAADLPPTSMAPAKTAPAAGD